jgi:hypothetical protein
MVKTELISSQQVEYVKSMVVSNLQHPLNGELFKQLLDRDIQSMIGFRVQRKQGSTYPSDPDSIQGRGLVHGQLACEIYKGEVILARNIWEDHDDIRARKEIPERDFRVSGEQFFLRNLPQVPIIRCDTPVPKDDLSKLKKGHVLLDPFYKVL